MAYVNFGRKNTREEALASTNKDKIFFPIDADTIIMGGREYGKDSFVGNPDDMYTGDGIEAKNLVAYVSDLKLRTQMLENPAPLGLDMFMVNECAVVVSPVTASLGTTATFRVGIYPLNSSISTATQTYNRLAVYDDGSGQVLTKGDYSTASTYLTFNVGYNITMARDVYVRFKSNFAEEVTSQRILAVKTVGIPTSAPEVSVKITELGDMVRVVALIDDFSPDGITVSWKINGAVTNDGITTMPVTKKKNGKYMCISYLERTRRQMESYTSVIVQVTHLGKTKEKKAPPMTSHEYVDLGLPSGLLWATCNIGADTPYTYAFTAFQWGETEGNPIADKQTDTGDRIYDDSHYERSDIGASFSPTSGYDAAREKWGGAWRMPTTSEFRELYDNCTNVWTTINGINGRLFTSKINGKTVFFPACGYCGGSSRNSRGSGGNCWSSSWYSSSYACYLYFDGTNVYPQYYSARCRGRAVRPVL